MKRLTKEQLNKLALIDLTDEMLIQGCINDSQHGDMLVELREEK